MCLYVHTACLCIGRLNYMGLGLTCPIRLSYPTRVFCSGVSRAGIGRPGTLCVGAAAERSAAVSCVRVGGGVSIGETTHIVTRITYI